MDNLFASKVQQIAPLAVLVQSLPLWSNKTGIKATIVSSSVPGVQELSINFIFSEQPTEEQFDMLIKILEDSSKLLILQETTVAMREAGTPTDVIELIVQAADDLAAQLKQ